MHRAVHRLPRSLLGLALAGVTGCSPDTAEGPAKEANAELEREPVQPQALTPDTRAELEDAVLALRVRLRLFERLRGDALAIEVGADRGSVALSGTVREPSDKLSALEIARSIDGVKRVRDRIEVLGSDVGGAAAGAPSQSTGRLADGLLLARTKLRLARELGAAALDLEVDVEDQVVTLRGRVADGESRARALQAVEAIEGVSEIRDLLASAAGERGSPEKGADTAGAPTYDSTLDAGPQPTSEPKSPPLPGDTR